MAWFQTSVLLPKHKRGFHWATDYFTRIKEIKDFKIGQMHIFLQENDASICLCESWDQSVTEDMETIFNRIVPDSLNQYGQKHNKGKKNKNKNKNKNQNNDEEQKEENSDKYIDNDSIVPRAKNILIGNDVTIPISNGSLKMGTWQGIWLCEHNDNAKPRTFIVTINGLK